jgi:arylsulfatase A-like enzyme
MLGEVLGAFARRAPGGAPIVIVTADHGEALGEHGHPFHSTDLYDSQIRVPLVITGPGIAQRRVAEAVSLTDIVPTVLDLGGFAAPSDGTVDGRSFADLATGQRPGNLEAGIAFAAMIKDRSNPGGVTAINKGHWKLIDDTDRLELYDTAADPGERDNALDRHPQIAAELQKLLASHAERVRQPPFH